MTPPKIYGLIGYPVKHSLSPQMHNAAFKASKINAEYKLFEIKPEELEDFLLKRGFLVKDIDGNPFYAKDIEGFNITIPHKVRAREIIERKFPFDHGAYLVQPDLYYVKLSGAVNTVVREADKLKYWNTDPVGFLKSLEKDLEFQPKDKNVLLIGCGGAGRAIIASLSWIQVGIRKIYINDIHSEALDSAKKHFSEFKHLKEKLEFISTEEEIAKNIKNCQLLVNASPVGMKEGDGSVINKELLHKDLSVYDVVYNQETQLIKEAKSLGLRAVGGLGMLLYQGALSFTHFTGKEPSIQIMHQALIQGVNKL